MISGRITDASFVYFVFFLPTSPVLTTTATANHRVVDDIKKQLGDDIELIRGPLVRKSLKLQNINLLSPAARMAWLARTLPKLPGSGIIYALTQRDAEKLTEWLQKNDIVANTYHAGSSDREGLERRLLDNKVKVLIATVALGMGFDKPDLGFVIHFQRPASVVHYYQQVGRAGRAVDEAYGILLCGKEDDDIADYFIRNAFPPQQHINDILKALDKADDGLSRAEIQRSLNISYKQIEKTIKYLTREFPSPIVENDGRCYATSTAAGYRIDQEHVDRVIRLRRQEQKQMHEYMTSTSCLMAFLQKALDDPNPRNCGKCRNCNPESLLSEWYDDALKNRAALFLKRNYQAIKPRQQWPEKDMFEHHRFEGKSIPAELRGSEGRALSLWRDAGWGTRVYSGKYKDGRFVDELVTACVEMIVEWNPGPSPKWLTCIPSLTRPELVPNFAARLADKLDLPFVACIKKTGTNRPQKEMANSFQQAKNLDGVFKVNLETSFPCLLIDDMVDSRWTFTVASALLRQAGCLAVYPMALALNSLRMN